MKKITNLFSRRQPLDSADDAKLADMPDKKDQQYYKAYLEHQTISRRGLFTALSKGAQVSVQDAAPSRIQAIARPCARPPHAVDETKFVSLCNHESACRACIDACPEQIIEQVDKRPSLNLELAACTHCGECVNACPSGALSLDAPQDNQMRPVFYSHCNNQTSYCSMCVDACPQSVLSHLDDALPALNTEICNGCGQCVQACYIQAAGMAFTPKNSLS